MTYVDPTYGQALIDAGITNVSAIIYDERSQGRITITVAGEQANGAPTPLFRATHTTYGNPAAGNSRTRLDNRSLSDIVNAIEGRLRLARLYADTDQVMSHLRERLSDHLIILALTD